VLRAASAGQRERLRIMQRTEAVAQLKQVYSVLARDLDEIVEYGRSNPSPFAHRTLVRTHFALMKGFAYQLRQVTLASQELLSHLSAAEICLLKEERYAINSKGHVEPRENYQNFLPSLLFTIQCYLKNHGRPITRTPDIYEVIVFGALSLRNRCEKLKTLK